MAKPISAQTLWTLFASLFALMVAGGMAYMYLVVGAVAPVEPQPQRFAVDAITELTLDRDKTGVDRYAGNVFFKTTKIRPLPAPYQGEQAVPYNRATEFGKSDLSSGN